MDIKATYGSHSPDEQIVLKDFKELHCSNTLYDQSIEMFTGDVNINHQDNSGVINIYLNVLNSQKWKHPQEYYRNWHIQSKIDVT